MAVLFRNEHCPPHAHVGEHDWDARFQFSFWHNGVCLWDVAPSHRAPKAALLEELRQRLKVPEHLHRARTLWWQGRGCTCLENQRWDPRGMRVVASRDGMKSAVRIVGARFDPRTNKTVLNLASQEDLEIEL